MEDIEVIEDIKDKEDINCLICRDETEEVLSCGHYCHVKCMNAWLAIKKDLNCVYCFKYLPEFAANIYKIENIKEQEIYIPEGVTKVECHYCEDMTFYVPDSVIEIEAEYNKNIKFIGSMTGLVSLNCSHNSLGEFVIPPGIKKLKCGYNYLTELFVPEGLEVLYCNNNKLTELTISKGIKELYCADNKLTKLIVVPEMRVISCARNLLTELTVYDGIERLFCYDNLLTKLVIPIELNELDHDSQTSITWV